MEKLNKQNIRNKPYGVRKAFRDWVKIMDELTEAYKLDAKDSIFLLKMKLQKIREYIYNCWYSV